MGYTFSIMLISVALILALLGGPGAAHQKKTQPHAATNKADHNQDVVPPQGAVVNPVSTAPHSQPESSKEQPKPTSKPLPWFVRPEWVIAWITAACTIISGFQLWAIKRQADTMDRQAREVRESTKETTAVALETAQAAKASADAAMLNTNALMDSTRAWVLIKEIDSESMTSRWTGHMGDMNAFYCRCRVQNFGGTPALIARVSGELQAGYDKITPPDPAIFSKSGQAKEYRLAQGETFTFELKSKEEFSDVQRFANLTMEVYGGQQFLWACGRIVYDDVHERPRETRFCYLFEKTERGGRDFRITGPPEYNRTT